MKRKPARPAQRNRPPAGPASGGLPASAQRLQKALAAAGVGSRRQCEELILEGRVEVDRQVVNRLGTRVDPREQEIRVDGVPLPRPRRLYFLVHKPPGVVCTNRDPAGRPRVIDLVPARDQRLFPVGRLDMSSEGLILVTNDGELANRLTHPRYEVEKTYLVEVAGSIEREALDKLTQGIHLAEGLARAARVQVKHRHGQSTTLEIVLKEGRNREIRRLLARLGHKAVRLKRTAIGPVRLADLGRGESRVLLAHELKALEQAAGAQPARRRRRRPAAGGAAKPRHAAGPAGRTVIGGDAAAASHRRPGPRPRPARSGRRP